MQRRLRVWLDIFGFCLLIGGLLAGLSVFSADSANPGDNPLGRIGVWAAQGLLGLFGAAVYVLFGAWMVAALTVFLSGRKGAWYWRLLGWIVLVPACALLLHLFNPEQTRSPVGGVLGAGLYALAATHLSVGGIFLIASTALLCGLGLAGDTIWPQVTRFIGKRLQHRYQVFRSRMAKRALLKAEESATEAARKLELKQVEEVTAPEPVVDEIEDKEPLVQAPGSVRKLQVRHPAPLPQKMPSNSYQLPPFDLLEDPEPFPYEEHDAQLRERAAKLEQTFSDFSLNVQVVGINTGPVITQYEVALETGLRVHKVTSLADDLALNLKVPSVRIVAPIPGKDTVGIEVPNESRAIVRLKEILLNSGPALEKSKVPLFLGKDTEGLPLVYDLAEMPHLLIAGRTGTGKSVCMNTIILSILMSRRPDEVKMIMIDPKMLELSEYGRIPHLMHPVVKDMRKAEAILAWAVDKMEERYDILSRARVRNIASYNELTPDEIYKRVNPVDEDERARVPEQMPYIVIFVDEMNDLMMTMRKEVESHIIRLAQKSRAAGIHLVVATQKPTVDVITGLIKSNLPARICFQVSSRSDSRVVLDEMGADKLLGRGDMLFLQPGTSSLVRSQGVYASDMEISRIVDHLECEPEYSRELIQLSTSKRGDSTGDSESLKSRDELYEQAIEVIVREGRGSVSLLQRSLGIGYGRAARLIDFMAEDGIVGPYNGSSAREVILTPEQWDMMNGDEAAMDAA